MDAIVVYRLDRISRNISDFSTLIEELGGLNIAFISIREQFDTASPMGRAMMYIASVFSQLERETIAERIRDNMHELAKTGRWLGGITPTGYASESVMSLTLDGKTKKACKLRLIEEEARIVRLVYDLFLETHSLTSTEAELISRGAVSYTHLDVYKRQHEERTDGDFVLGQGDIGRGLIEFRSQDGRKFIFHAVAQAGGQRGIGFTKRNGHGQAADGLPNGELQFLSLIHI